MGHHASEDSGQMVQEERAARHPAIHRGRTQCGWNGTGGGAGSGDRLRVQLEDAVSTQVMMGMMPGAYREGQVEEKTWAGVASRRSCS